MENDHFCHNLLNKMMESIQKKFTHKKNREPRRTKIALRQVEIKIYRKLLSSQNETMLLLFSIYTLELTTRLEKYFQIKKISTCKQQPQGKNLNFLKVFCENARFFHFIKPSSFYCYLRNNFRNFCKPNRSFCKGEIFSSFSGQKVNNK